MYGPYLTIAEINAKYPNTLVLLGNPTRSRQGGTGGHVILHATDRAEFYRLLDGWDDPDVKHLASWYTGAISTSTSSAVSF
ncbi:hypothetical protein [Frigoriglobus tundricola]|uniref:Uncharacterized protein n=1 Tax=Frigoriglobus tundricola TaxID=2774151 RepID=A0A6M5YJX5_9BACT|nr:hypothetical protein [Frigoriglobus tundricola]QJW94337.1 hypothetical protein FTUN_1857 [Frigoriglobus tundricola]